MSDDFTLEVELSGLILYVHDEKTQRVTLLMPDARRWVKRTHEDGSVGQPHLGFLRFDLRNLAGIQPDLVKDNSPPIQVVHRFDRQELRFVPEQRGLVAGNVDLPTFSSSWDVKDGMLDPAPPPGLLMRAILDNGTLQSSDNENIDWTFPDPDDDSRVAVQSFASTGTFTRGFDNYVELQIRGIAPGATSATFCLKPVEGETTVRIAIANLCAENPLEWEELEYRQQAGPDVDFKWLYRLLKNAKNPEGRTTIGHRVLAVPGIGARGDKIENAVLDCFGGVLKRG
jgi:hypothetical protein